MGYICRVSKYKVLIIYIFATLKFGLYEFLKKSIYPFIFMAKICVRVPEVKFSKT